LDHEHKGLLAAIVHFSTSFRGVVIALAGVVLAYGLYTLTRAKYDVFPEFAPPLVAIQTEAPGLAPEQVEVLVTQPIENAINGVPGIESLRSQSIQGLSVVAAVFDPGSDLYRDRQALAERLAALATQLPQGVAAPTLSPLTSSTSTVMVVGLTSDKRSLMELRTFADWTVKQRLLAVPGVAKVTVFGGEPRELQIQVQPEQLIRHGLALDDVIKAARRATGVRGAGFIDNDNQRLVLQSEGQALAATQIARTVLIHENGANLLLGDVARIADASEPLIGAAAIMGKPGVQLVVSEQFGANTLEATERVERALDELKPMLEAQGVVLHSDIFRPATFIQAATGNVLTSLWIGAALVIVVLVLFLFNWRTAAISLVAIPLSLLAAAIALDYLGMSLNTMTLGGLAIAIGLLVDDAVITVENVYRRLRESRRLPSPRTDALVVLDATLEVRSAVVYATLAIALVFLPILALPGIAGRLFAPLAVSYVLATLASLVVALTVTPAMCLALLSNRPLPERDPPVVRWLKEKYRGILIAVEARHRVVIAAAGLLTLAGLAALPFFGGGFIPELREGHFIVHMSAVPGTSLKESLRLGAQVTQDLLKLPFVRTVAQQVGRAEKADDTWGTHYSEFNVDLKPLEGDEAEFAQGDVRKALALFPGVNFAVKTFLTERVEETLSGYMASVVVNIYGNDLDIIDRKAQEVARVLSSVSGATEVQVQSPPGMPQLVLKLKPNALMHWGFDPVEVLDTIRTAYQGDVVGQVYDGNRVYNVSVILDLAHRGNLASVRELTLKNPTGTYVKLKEIASIYQSSGRYVVLHNGARRVQTITCNVAGRDVTSFVSDAKKQLAANVSLPAGSYVEFSGAAQAQQRSTRDLIVNSVIAAIALILLLGLVMGSPRNLLLVLLNLPFALVGGVLAVFALGGWISIGALVGFVTLFGITLRNTVMMISHFEHLVASEGMSWGLDAALRGAQERLSPILMTALVTALGLLPLAIGSGAPGNRRTDGDCDTRWTHYLDRS
jgi:CzcA family heavy metal efflux pump